MNLCITHTVENELAEVLSCLKEADFLISHGYSCVLPAGIELTRKYKESEILDSIKRERTQNLPKLKQKEAKIIKFWQENKSALEKFFGKFSYPVPEEVKVEIISYGPGGSYWPPSRVLLRADLGDTNLKVSDEENLVHEIIHLIVEEPVVEKFKLSQNEKEGLVSWFFLSDELKEIFPDFELTPNYKEPTRSLIENLEWN